jgi:hypothetical protein
MTETKNKDAQAADDVLAAEKQSETRRKFIIQLASTATLPVVLPLTLSMSTAALAS